jgi:hypothetical protein
MAAVTNNIITTICNNSSSSDQVSHHRSAVVAYITVTALGERLICRCNSDIATFVERASCVVVVGGGETTVELLILLSHLHNVTSLSPLAAMGESLFCLCYLYTSYVKARI